MTGDWKPKGYSSVSPYLVVEGAQRVVDFIVEVFDGKILRRYDRFDGSIMHIEVQIDDTIVVLGNATSTWKPVQSQLHVYVKDVKHAYRRAIDASYVSVSEPAKKDGDPDRRAGIADPSGNTWWIATQEG